MMINNIIVCTGAGDTDQTAGCDEACLQLSSVVTSTPKSTTALE